MQLRIQDYGMAVREIIVEVSGEVALHEAKKCFQLGEQVRVAGIIDKEVVPLPQPMNKNKNCPGFRLILKVAYMIPFEPVPSLFYGTRCFDQSLRDTFSEKVLATSSTAATAGTAEVARRIKTIFNGKTLSHNSFMPVACCTVRTSPGLVTAPVRHILTSVAASMFPSFRQEQARKIAKALILAVASSSDGSFVGDHLRILLLQESGDSSAWQAMVQGVTTVHPGALPMRCCSSVQLLPSTSNDSHWVRAGELTGISSRDETITRSGEEHLETVTLASALLGSAAGVCLLEHIDKLPKPQLNALVSDRPMKPLPGLSVRTFRRCSLLATINVKYGRYDASRKLADNLGPLTKLASSFDLILLSPSVTPQASYVRGSGGKAILDLPEAISYLKYVRDTKSDLPWSEEAEEYFKKRLNQLGEASQNNHMAGVTPPVTSALRKSTLLRMCRGCARIELSDKIDVVHVKQALEIYLVSASMRQDALGISDISEEVAQHESAETRTVRRRGKGKAARRREFLSLCQQEFRRREELTGNELRDLAREAGCELDAECDALIEEANYTGCILKKSGDVYEYCR
ncbi:hypothetical protein FOL47_010384 [Perkinsus chesapeaki]|uniref:MCM C-terminal AAA(+) ATPase domain-containing protein n=1 Tax=Perkinsus chesapeaki TaxID=330153 RepID=A0A7J6N2U9_PERCH|nr:hypothetical protein FOL47_010384 [Perkinsus chesapeaki]